MMRDSLMKQFIGIERRMVWHDQDTGRCCPHINYHQPCQYSITIDYRKWDIKRRNLIGAKWAFATIRPSLWTIIRMEAALWRAPWQKCLGGFISQAAIEIIEKDTDGRGRR